MVKALRFGTFALMALVLMVISYKAFAQAPTFDVTLTWDAPTQRTDGSPLTNLAGFKVYYGTAPGNLDQVIMLPCQTPGTPAMCNTDGYVMTQAQLQGNTVYFFAATAYDTNNLESTLSNIASKLTPSTAPPGPPTNVVVEIVLNFGAGV